MVVRQNGGFEALGALESLNRAIESAEHLTSEDYALVTEARRLAAVLDLESFPLVDGKFDNTTPKFYQEALNALGLTPVARSRREQAAKVKAETADKGSEVESAGVSSLEKARRKYNRSA